MSYCKSEGKDKIIFVTKEDHTIPSKVPFPEEDEDDRPAGLVLPNGDINWGCPCLGGMATGPCGVDFREAFSCFHYSKADPKGSDCLENFRKMTECMSQYPGVYGPKDGDDEEAEEKLFKPLEDGANANESENKETDSRTSQISKSSSTAS